jgi:hypothetical protein
MTTKDHVASLLWSLEHAIRQDRRFFVAAKADPVLSPVKEQVEELLGRLLHEAKAQAEMGLTHAQSAFAELKAWHGETAAINKTMAKLEATCHTGSYFGYLDTIPLAAEVKAKIETVIQDTRASARSSLNEARNQVGAMRSSAVALMGDSVIPKESRNEKTERMADANRRYNEASRQMQTEQYESWVQALQSFRQCIGEFGPLVSDLKREKNNILAEARYQERVVKAEAEHQEKLVRLHLAMVFLLLYCITPWVGALMAWNANKSGGNLSDAILSGLAWGGVVWGGVASVVFLVVADRIWSIGKNEPGSEVQWHWLWLILLTAANILIAPILTIVVYVRGMLSIQAEFTSTMDYVERHRIL